MPKNGFFPQMSQTAAMANRGYQTPLLGLPSSPDRQIVAPEPREGEGGMADAEGLFAYVFVEAADPGKSVRELVGKLVDRHEVWFSVDVAGAYEGFVVVETPGLEELQRFLGDAELWTDQKDVLLEASYTTSAAKRERCEILGIVRIRTERGAVQQVFEALDARVRDEPDRFHGVSIVFGRFDILLTLDGTSIDELKDAVLQLQDIEGIVHTETSFADCRNKRVTNRE